MARRSKRNRQAQQSQNRRGGGAQPTPFPFPEVPSRYRLRWLNAKPGMGEDAPFVIDQDVSPDNRIALFTTQLPDDMAQRAKWLVDHGPEVQRLNLPDDRCASFWHVLHEGWQSNREYGVIGFLQEQIDLMGGFDQLNLMGGLKLSVEPLPEDRHVLRFLDPHIVLAIFPDGNFCRLLAKEVWGTVAIGVRAEEGMDTILGPVSLGIKGMILTDGRPHDEAVAQEPCIILLDPLTVLGDMGPVASVSADGMLQYEEHVQAEKFYSPNDDPWHQFLPDHLKNFLKLWGGGPVPGYAGRIGALRRKLAEGEENPERVPVNPQYMEALERQLETARFMRDRHPVATVSRQMGVQPHRFDYDAIIAEGLETATTHYWTGHMCDLLARSYPNLPEWWLRPNEVGPRRGYCWFSQPIPLVEGDPEKLRALMWMLDPDTGDYMIVPFTVFDGPGSDLYVVTFRTYHGVPRQVQTWKEGQALTDWLGDQVEDDSFRRAVRIAGTDAPTLLGQRIAWGRVFATAVAIMNQVLVKVEPYGPDRPSRKRIEKLRPPGLHPPAPIVRAVLLRRQYTVRPGTKGDHEPVDWQYQWKVTEHWRQQYYPSLQAHKWILILEHIKGPPDKPLKTPLPIKIVGR